ncbi:VOC family protein [Gymnodinialimonas ulvae]|uniref:VOC family protein n=1 Tax=Gymnodinialimonas ulvae TaxID=3126504 RepID=UPI0030A324DC
MEQNLISHAYENTGCWFEIPVTDLDAARNFYAEVLQIDLSVSEDGGPNPIVFFPYNDDAPGTGGHLYPGTPPRDGNTVHLMAPPGLDAMRERIVAAGGSVESPDIQIPTGAFFYARDPDGNSIGFFQLQRHAVGCGQASAHAAGCPHRWPASSFTQLGVDLCHAPR